MNIMKIAIPEREVNKNFEIGEEISIECDYKIYSGKIINTMHDPILLRLNIFIQVYDEKEKLENEQDNI